MNGTGTQADPYQITTVEELVSVVTKNDITVYAKLMNDIDFNNSDYINLDSMVFRLKEFDGQNHKISNIYTDKGTCFEFGISYNTQVIKNVIIEAVVINYTNDYCCLFKHIGDYSCEFNNCDFRVKLNNNNKNVNGMFICKTLNSNKNFTFNNCIFNIDTYLYDNVPRSIMGDVTNKSYVSYYFNYCEFNLNLISMCTIDHTVATGSSSADFYSLFPGTNTGVKMEFKFCPIFINIYNLGKDECILAQIYGQYGAFNLYNSYIIIQSKGKYPNATIKMANITCTATCFYDKELSGNFIFDESSLAIDNLYGLTTAQCKDPAYLESIGFFIAY